MVEKGKRKSAQVAQIPEQSSEESIDSDHDSEQQLMPVKLDIIHEGAEPKESTGQPEDSELLDEPVVSTNQPNIFVLTNKTDYAYIRL
jgi:hypothetical protein